MTSNQDSIAIHTMQRTIADMEVEREGFQKHIAALEALVLAQFPIIPDLRQDSPVAPHPMKVPWSVAELAYSVYVRRGGGDQSLERLAERGGFGASEMDMFLPDWRERVVAMEGLVRAK